MTDDSRPTPILDPVSAYAHWAPNYPAQAHNPLMRAEERAMLALLPGDLRGYAVFDGGCGTGRYMIHALRRGAARVVGADLSIDMLRRADAELRSAYPAAAHPCASPQPSVPHSHLLQAHLDALPLRDRWADLTICGLTIGHLESLEGALAELHRVTRPGGIILCSDFHPLSHARGWRREFNAKGQRYAVRHTPFQDSDWRGACASLGLRIVSTLEPRLDPADIPAGARFDPAARDVPVAIVYELSTAAVNSADREASRTPTHPGPALV
jgi:malonyl-CoA O-methyltransferase